MGRAEDIFKKIETEGEAAIEEFVASRKSEELFLDFKRSSENGSGKKLSQNDRENLAKCISGFGNSEGGVIIWGVDCSNDKDGADVPHSYYPIENPVRFVSWLEGAISGCTIPPHTGVRNHAVVKTGHNEGYVATYISKSNHAPHQVVSKLQYYIRAGSNFVPTPHAVLAGMFGRRPQPEVYHMYIATPINIVGDRLEFQVGFMIRNNGPGLAGDLFMNVMISSFPGDNCVFQLEPINSPSWSGQFSFGMHISMISKPELKLPPESWVQPFILHVVLAPPFTNKLAINGICGCGEAPSCKFMIKNDCESIKKLYQEFMEEYKTSSLPIKESNFIDKLFNSKMV